MEVVPTIHTENLQFRSYPAPGSIPAQIIFGTAIDLDRGIFKPNIYDEEGHNEPLSKYIDSMMQSQTAATKLASDMQRRLDAKHLAERTKALTGEVTEFEAGTYVLVEYPDDGFLMRPRPPHKLLTNLKGPLKVMSSVGPAYTLRDDTSATKDLVVHVSRLREFYYDRERVNPTEVAMKDTDQYLVEAILDHRGYTGQGSSKRSSDLEFLVKWVGYDKPEWQPWKEYYANSIAHNYMRQYPALNKIIPARFND